MATPNTHLEIDPELVGAPLEVSAGHAKAELVTDERMRADAEGLVHGGFVFGLADYAAMLAVNDPNVVLGGAEVRFVKPVGVGETLHAVADVRERKGNKQVVEVSCAVVSGGSEESGGAAAPSAQTTDAREVFTGSFTCFVLDQHVLSASGSARPDKNKTDTKDPT